MQNLYENLFGFVSVAGQIMPWKGISTNAEDLDSLILDIIRSSERRFTLYSSSWSEHPNGYSGFCSRSGYGADFDTVSGLLLVPSDGAYIFHGIISLSSGEVTMVKKAKSEWS